MTFLTLVSGDAVRHTGTLPLLTREDAATETIPSMTLARLAEFGEAWRRKDVERLLEFMTEDGVYSASVGPEPGQVFRGTDELREDFTRMLAYDTGAERHGGQMWIFGDRGVSLWSFAGTDEHGRTVEIEGIDLFEFEGDRIKLKDAYRKTFPVPA